MTKKTISHAMEDYLKAVFELGEHNIKTQDLASALSVSPASVTGMLKKLSDLQLIQYERYRGVGLTPAGRLVALETIRHHRLLETYLSQALGYEWHEIHDEAEKLEHVISEDFEARISDWLGDPTHDPHGDPIPRLDGSIPASSGVPLSEFDINTSARITRITNQKREVLRYFAEHNLKPGTLLSVKQKAPFDGPLTLELNNDSLVLAFALAQSIYATRT